MNTEKLLNLIKTIIEDTKGLDIVSIDVSDKNAFADYMVVCHGTSTAHIKGISDNIGMSLKKEKLLPLGVEGYNEARWILMDYDAVIVHIFLENTRDAYRIEDLYTATTDREKTCETSE